jgi:hypothetical protein
MLLPLDKDNDTAVNRINHHYRVWMAVDLEVHVKPEGTRNTSNNRQRAIFRQIVKLRVFHRERRARRERKRASTGELFHRYLTHSSLLIGGF